ncbi:MAG: hypothetical protein HONBIEJF_00397 [Fimbriimonadaceae bacterium]|nr:hypothetical protein [Fimbriimonadaceae bacterium]
MSANREGAGMIDTTPDHHLNRWSVKLTDFSPNMRFERTHRQYGPKSSR